MTEGHQPEGSRQTEKEVTILGSECVFGTAPSRNPDMFHPEEATRDAKTFYGRGKKRSSPMHQSDMDDRVPVSYHVSYFCKHNVNKGRRCFVVFFGGGDQSKKCNSPSRAFKQIFLISVFIR